MLPASLLVLFHLISLNLNERKFRNLQEGESRLIKWKCVGSSKTGFKSLCRVTVRWKGQKLTNIEPLSWGQRLGDKAAIRFLCSRLLCCPAGALDTALERVLHLMELGYANFSPEASRPFSLSSASAWFIVYVMAQFVERFMKAGNWKWGHNSWKASFGTRAVPQRSRDRRQPRGDNCSAFPSGPRFFMDWEYSNGTVIGEIEIRAAQADFFLVKLPSSTFCSD